MGLKAVFLVGKVAEFTDSYHFWNVFCCMWKSMNIKSTPKTFKTEETGLQNNFPKRKQNCFDFLSFCLPTVFIQMENYLHLFLNSHAWLSFNFTPYTPLSYIPAHTYSRSHKSLNSSFTGAGKAYPYTYSKYVIFHASSLFTHIYTHRHTKLY